jgi:hypothetical protein
MVNPNEKRANDAGGCSYETRIDIPSNTKQVSTALLNARLADTIDLSLLTKQAHWNLRGPQFIAVHEMLDGFRDQIDEWSDTMDVSPNSEALRWARRRPLAPLQP